MYAIVVTLKIRADRIGEFDVAITKNRQACLADEPGCLRFDILRAETEDTDPTFVLYEVYQDEDAYLVGHRGAPHYAQWRAAVPRFLVEGGQTITRAVLLDDSEPIR